VLSWVTYALSPRAVPTATAGLIGKTVPSRGLPHARTTVPTVMRLEDELCRVCVHRNPPVEVVVSRPMDNGGWPGLLYGWANNVTDDRTLRGLVLYRREHAPGFWTDVIS
jgi:hypothetical protein